MSNVLIGIIGVILFIGLALAGALFLGPRFQDATANSTASASVAAATQIAHGLSLMQVTEGVDYDPSSTVDSQLVAKGYLKSQPTVAGSLAFISNDTVAPYTKGATVMNPRYSIVVFADGAKGERICRSVVAQTGGDGKADLPTTSTPSGTIGCIRYSGDSGFGMFTGYMVWVRIR